MKKILGAMVVIAAVSAMAAGCSKSDGASGEAATDVTAGTVVNRADLVGALWGDAAGDAEKAEPTDADCVAASTFIVRDALGFNIRANGEPSDNNVTPSVIVSPINIEISDEAGVQRGAGCGEGDLAYVVTAGEEQPIDIEAAADVAATNPVDAAAVEAAPYAEGCDVIAHFEAHGDPSCGEPIPLESSDDAEGDGSEADVPDEVDCTNQPTVQTFKLVVDQVICSETVEPLPEAK